MILLKSNCAVVVAVCLLVTLVNGQGYGDLKYECQAGYRVAAISREPSRNNKVGEMTIECEAFGKSLSPKCEKMSGPLSCDGSDEPCKFGSWLGGLYGFELDRDTGAVLFQPICCRDPKIKIIRGSCQGERLNSIRSGFNKNLRSDEVFTSFKCWKQYDVNNVIHDFIWKPKICRIEYDSSVLSERFNEDYGDDSTCERCNCNCGPFTCPAGRRVTRMVHRRRKRATCVCDCECSFKCV